MGRCHNHGKYCMVPPAVRSGNGGCNSKIFFPGLTILSESLICLMLGAAFLVVWAYDKGSTGVKIFDWILKIMVGVVVISFFGVVVKLSSSGEANWNQIMSGFIPDFSFTQPAEIYLLFLNRLANSKFLGDENRWPSAGCYDFHATTAVGINMTFFMPFVLLRRK